LGANRGGVVELGGSCFGVRLMELGLFKAHLLADWLKYVALLPGFMAAFGLVGKFDIMESDFQLNCLSARLFACNEVELLLLASGFLKCLFMVYFIL